MVDDAISRLAASGAQTRGLMSAGFVTFGVAVPLFSISLRGALEGRAWMATTVAGLATIGVAATPLDVSAAVDMAHGAFATTAYIAMAAAPLLAAAPFEGRGFHKAARASEVVSAIAATCLATTVVGSSSGLLQRAGLTIVDVWMVSVALAIANGRLNRQE
jgi:hypothetical membrane protein